jgi:glycosyltransferase involved in cell wall biosynthesis
MKYFIPYTPIDKFPVPQLVLDRLRYAYKILTFSKFGQDSLMKAGFTSQMIYEGTDTNIFKPMDKMQCRKDLGLNPNDFIFGSIAANKENPPRKGFQEMLDAFKLFYANHPDGAMYFHTQQLAPGNFPIIEYARYLGFANRIFFLQQYKATHNANSELVAKELNAFDIDLHASQTEGFGLGVVESQSCSTPVIVNRCQSMPELVVENKTGWICETGQPRWSTDNGYVYPADVKSLHEKMEIAYKVLHENNTVGNDARSHVLKNFSIDKIYEEQWIPFFEELQNEILPIIDNSVKK